MKKYYPYKTALLLLKIVAFVLCVSVSVLARIILSPYRIIMWLVILLFWLAYIIVLYITMPIYFSRTNYFISSQELVKHSGIIFFTRQIMRMDSVQYVSTISTPLSKYTGFNFIIFNALGGRTIFFFLTKKDMLEINSIVSSYLRQKKQDRQ